MLDAKVIGCLLGIVFSTIACSQQWQGTFEAREYRSQVTPRRDTRNVYLLGFRGNLDVARRPMMIEISTHGTRLGFNHGSSVEIPWSDQQPLLLVSGDGMAAAEMRSRTAGKLNVYFESVRDAKAFIDAFMFQSRHWMRD